MRGAVIARASRSQSSWSFLTLIVLSSLGGYAVARSEAGLAASGALVIAVAATTWLLTTTRAETRSTVLDIGTESRVLSAPRAAFLIGLLLIGQLVLRPVYSTTASDYFFLAALVMTLGGLLFSNRQSGFIPGGIAIGAGMFAVGACASAFSSVEPSASLSVALRVLYITLIWFWLATVLLRRARDVRLGVCLWVISLAVSGTAGFAQLLLGDVIPNTDAAFGRMTGTAQHFNDFGGSGAVALPAAAGLLLLSQAGRSVRLVGAVGTVAIAGGLLLSGSVGGMLAAAVGMSSFAVVARRVRSLWIAAAVVASATLATWHAQASNGAETIVRRINTVSASEGSLNARFEVFRLAWAQIADHPFIGTGFGLDPTTAGARLPDLIHNAYLGAWYQGGLLALVGLAVICLTSLRVGLRTAREATDPDELVLAGSLVGAFVSYLVFGLGEPALYVRYGWVPVALVLALRGIQLRRGRSDQGPT